MGRARYLVIAAALALAACGDESKPDVGKITDDLAHDVQAETGTRDVHVVCPDDVSEGDVCDMTAAGGLKAKIRVTQIDGDAKGEIVQP
jgi:hypothetical protein